MTMARMQPPFPPLEQASMNIGGIYESLACEKLTRNETIHRVHHSKRSIGMYNRQLQTFEIAFLSSKNFIEMTPGTAVQN